MTGGRTETTRQAVRRHLRNGWIILSERGLGALYGAAMREAAKLEDQPVGVFLAPRDILRERVRSAIMRPTSLRSQTASSPRAARSTIATLRSKSHLHLPRSPQPVAQWRQLFTHFTPKP